MSETDENAELRAAVEHHRAGKIGEAEKGYRAVIVANPDDADAQANLAMLLATSNRLGEAIGHFAEVARLRPGSAADQSNLGNALLMTGRWDEAIAACRRAIEIDPNFAEAHNNLGSALQSKGELPEAIASYRRAVEIRGDFAEALNNLGNALYETGKVDEAIEFCGKAVRLRPNFALAQNNLGLALLHRGRIEEAIARCRRAVEIDPRFAGAFNNLGNALRENLRIDEALAAYARALELNPKFAGVLSNAALLLKDLGKTREALSALRKAILLNPEFADAQLNLAHILWGEGQVAECLAACRKAMELQPASAQAHSALLFYQQFDPGHDAPMILEEHQRWYEHHARQLSAENEAHGNDRNPDRRLRIGFVSPYFREHCQSFFTIPLLGARDRNSFEVVCYSDVMHADAVTARIRGMVDEWRSTVGLSDEEVADLVREDHIDILVDLTMHMAGGRPLMFARKPAPVQVAWLAYPGTTGLKAMDYRLTDPFLDPPGEDHFYAEKSFRLPETFWCYDPLTEELRIGEPRLGFVGYVTFGCLNNLAKINEPVLRMWAALLKKVEDSHLLMLRPETDHAETILQMLEREGVSRERVEMKPRCSRGEYLSLYYQMDIALDTVPYNGHTTSLDALWMGVPVVTLAGARVAGRAGVSQLTNLGLTDLIARTPEEFVNIAAGLAADRVRVRELHRTLRQRMKQSPLMDAERFARGMESAVREMWRRYCAGE